MWSTSCCLHVVRSYIMHNMHTYDFITRAYYSIFTNLFIDYVCYIWYAIEMGEDSCVITGGY